MDKYFNKIEFEKIFKLSKINPFLAKELYLEYFKKYPEDYTTYMYLVSLLIKIREIDDALNVLIKTIELADNDKHFLKNNDKVYYLTKNALLNKLKILMYQEKYREFYELYLNNYEFLKDDIDKNNGLIVMCKSRLGILEYDRDYYNSYIYKQMIEYREEDFFYHIKKHQADYAADMDNPSSSIFVPGFPIVEIIDEIKKYIPSSKCFYSGYYNDLYIFKYDENGRDNYKMTDYFKVFTFHGNTNFITITPSLGCDFFPYVDLNYMKDEKDSGMVKRLSQIDKFNNRYNK